MTYWRLTNTENHDLQRIIALDAAYFNKFEVMLRSYDDQIFDLYTIKLCLAHHTFICMFVIKHILLKTIHGQRLAALRTVRFTP